MATLPSITLGVLPWPHFLLLLGILCHPAFQMRHYLLNYYLNQSLPICEAEREREGGREGERRDGGGREGGREGGRGGKGSHQYCMAVSLIPNLSFLLLAQTPLV